MKRVLPFAALVAAAAAALSGWPPAGVALRLAFVLASAPAIGRLLLSAIARVTGADWHSVEPPSRALWWWVPLAALAMLGATGVPVPSHLAVWSSPAFAALRAALTVAALAYAADRLRTGAGQTFAGVALASYAAVVTPIAADWLLPTARGHPVSAVGMMLFLIQFAAGCASSLLLADGRERRDLSLLLVAAAIGLCYLSFMDYLIVWFGNLPARVPFYAGRSGWLASAALLVGGVGTIAAVAAGRSRTAAGAAAAGLILFAFWWIGGGTIAWLLASLALAAAWSLRRFAHG